MKKLILSLLLPLILSAPALAEHRIGGGVNYWRMIDDIDIDNIDKDGLSYLVSYQYRMALVGLQADVEFLPDMFGDDAIAPAAYVLVGAGIYAAAGIGIINLDGDFADDPFFALKAGLDLEVLPEIYLDISASYRFNSDVKLEDAIDDINSDTVFLGAAARFAF